ncbi:MAG: hypothetical protein ACFFEY_03725 [Candidatus Thorarchaeota archaeon]
MISKTLDKKIQEIPVLELDPPLSLRDITIPFSHFSKPEKYIYYGEEKIPFNQRPPIYQAIFKREFAEDIKIFLEKRKK